MATHVISLRLPPPVDAALRASAAEAHLTVSAALEWLLRNSLGNFELLRDFTDCSRPWNSKLDARIPQQTFSELQAVSLKLGISISVYTRRLLHTFYIIKRVHYVKSDGHYTLAVRHD
jgi:hypothetical protein